MNILIVNAFGSSSQERSKFTSFCNLIKNSLKKFSQNSGIDNFCFIYRTPNTINDFISTTFTYLKINMLLFFVDEFLEIINFKKLSLSGLTLK